MKKFIKLMIAGASSILIWSSAAAQETEIDYQTYFTAQQVSIIEQDTSDLISSKLLIKDEYNNLLFETAVRHRTQYAIAAVRIRAVPTIDSEPIDTLSINDKITELGRSENGWSIIKIDKDYYFVWSEYLADEPIELPQEEEIEVELEQSYSASYFKRMGVLYWGDYRWTWYSDKVLPGGGLSIPGRHYSDSNYVCDEDGYICLASDDLQKGTVINTPFGRMGKIYDCGVSSGTIDVYVHW